MLFVLTLMISTGLFICFGGIYLKKVISILSGLVNGALFASTFIVIVFGISEFTEGSTPLYIEIAAGVFAAMCAINDKVTVFINSAITSFNVIALVGFLLSSSRNFPKIEASVLIYISIFASLVIAAFCAHFDKYFFIIGTAITGAFFACLGFAGLVERACDLYDIISVMTVEGKYTMLYLIGWIVLAIIGFIVQLVRLTNIESEEVNNSPENFEVVYNSDLNRSNAGITNRRIPGFDLREYGGSGVHYDNTYGVAEQNFSQGAPQNSFADGSWVCDCGHVNDSDYNFCYQCGNRRNV